MGKHSFISADSKKKVQAESRAERNTQESQTTRTIDEQEKVYFCWAHIFQVIQAQTMKNERLASSISLLCCLLLVLPIQGFVSVAPSSQPIPSLDVAAASTFIKLHPKTVLYAQAPSQKDAVLERPASSLSVSSSSSESTLDPSVVVVDGSSFSTPVDNDENNNNQEYQRGLWTIGFCTIVFASLSPAMHAALSSTSTAASDIVSCPVIFLNAVLSVVALVCLAVAGPSLETMIPPPSALVASSSTTTSPTEPATEADKNPLASWWNSIDVSVKAGSELGFWKFLVRSGSSWDKRLRGRREYGNDAL